MLATEAARDHVKENFSRDVVRLRYTAATMPKLKKGSRIDKMGDLEWILFHGDYIFVDGVPTAPSHVERMSQSMLAGLISRGSLFLAVEISR